jgi:hypothetical protein
VGILIAARERQGVYVWGAQVNAARRNGVPEAVIDLIRSRAEPLRLQPHRHAQLVGANTFGVGECHGTDTAQGWDAMASNIISICF